ncbi:MAG: endonuclease/exonuclease/phosphatase family protein [Thermoanaerobaculia bacterium]
MEAKVRAAFTMAVCVTACGEPSPRAGPEAVGSDSTDPETVRIALFNIRELDTDKILEIDQEGHGRHPQAAAAGKIIRRLAPDILVLNEIDHDYDSANIGLDLNARRFRDAYLAGGEDGLELPYSFAAPNNTGLLSELDLDGDGHVATDEDRGDRRHGNDSWGFGTYPGQYSMAILSRFPVQKAGARAFQELRWQDLPGHHMPPDHFAPAVAAALRLSSKSHWDVPIEIGDHVLHLFASHPTPQGFDGPEDKNGRRNFDEIKLWVEYLDGGGTLVDDQERPGGYDSEDPFVIVGDLNAAPLAPDAPNDGPFRTSVYDGVAAIDQLLAHPRIQDSGPLTTSSAGLVHNAETPRMPGPPRFPERSTSVFGPGSRIDYILPSVNLEMVSGGVFWPTPEEDSDGAAWADQASDHRLVWLDVTLD